MKPFRVYFNGRKQYVLVFVANDPARFKRKNKCHAWYIGEEVRHQRSGLFGRIYLSEANYSPLGHELVAHEIQHLIFDWVMCRSGMTFSTTNEERLATMTGEVSRNFWRGYQKAMDKLERA